MKVNSTTVKNKTTDKPNEDNLLVDKENQFFVVADGVTRDRENGVYPIPSPSAAVSSLLIDILRAISDKEQTLQALFENANKAIGESNNNFIGDFKPSAVAICLRIRNGIVEWISIGDCIGLLFRGKNTTKFNTKQTQKLREHAQKMTSKTIRTEICNNPEHPLGYGVLDGNANATSFFEFGSFEILQEDNICLLSDGLEMFIDLGLQFDLVEKTIDQIISKAESLEVERNIRTDDKTYIRIEI